MNGPRCEVCGTNVSEGATRCAKHPPVAAPKFGVRKLPHPGTSESLGVPFDRKDVKIVAVILLVFLAIWGLGKLIRTPTPPPTSTHQNE